MKFPPLRQKGFTLIELMVVIVIISIIASLIVLNIDGVDQRKAMQARELLILDLKKMNREAVDQSRIYALVIQSRTDVAGFGYRFDEYIPQRSQTNDATHRLNHSNALNSSNNNQNSYEAILYSLLSTFAGFGVLIFSNVNALFSIGITATIGILAITLLLIILKRSINDSKSI